MDLAQFVDARQKVLAHLQSISDYSSCASVYPTKLQKSIYLSKATNFSWTSSACLSEMGEEGNGLSNVICLRLWFLKMN